MKTIYLFIVMMSLSVAQIAAQNNNSKSINVVGFGSVSAFPNAATITLNIKFTRPTLRESVNETQKTEKEVIRIVKKYINDSTEIMKGFISTDKAHVWNNKLEKQVFIGFESQLSIVFPLRDLNKMEKFTEEILKTRIQEITSVSYFNTEGAQYFKKAQDYAIKDALETSQRIANVSSVKLGSILIINSDSSPNSSGQQTYNTSSFNAYGKGMGGSGVTSSGQLITYSTRINMSTSIVE